MSPVPAPMANLLNRGPDAEGVSADPETHLPAVLAANARRYAATFAREGAANEGFGAFFCSAPLVHFRGDLTAAKVVVFGRDPGYAEFASLTPFVGVGGQRLQGLLAHLGLYDATTSARQYLVTNLVRAHPPRNVFKAPVYKAAMDACAKELVEVPAIVEAATGHAPLVLIAGKANGALAADLFPDAIILSHPSPAGDAGRFLRDINGGQGEALARRLGVPWTPLPRDYAMPIPEPDYFPGGKPVARVRRANPDDPCERPAGAPVDPFQP